MKKTLFLVFFVMAYISYSQKKSVDLTLSSGISTPSSNFSDNSYASNGSFFQFSGGYYFSKIGLGVSLGQITNSTSSNLSDFTNSLDFSTSNTSDDWRITYYGAGPEFKTSFNKIEAKFIIRTGIMNVKPVSIKSNYNENADTATPIYDLQTDKISKISYLSTAIKIGYNLTKNFSVFATADYLSALSDELAITERKIQDINRNGTIDIEDILKSGGTAASYEITSTSIKPQSTNFGIGLSYSFGKRTIKIGGAEKPYARSTTNPYFVSNELTGDMVPANSNGSSGNGNNNTKAQDHNGSRSNTTASKTDQNSVENNNNNTKVKRKRPGRVKYDNITLKRNPIHEEGNTSGENPLYVGKERVVIVLTNPVKEKAEKKENQRKLVNVLPKNNSNFNRVAKIKSFSWEQKGSKIPNPQYVIEVVKISENKSPQRTYFAKTTKTSIKATTLFKEEQLSDGNYQWKVTETTTGTSSNHTYFTMTQCEIDFTIANEEIECLGYEQENRKFKICFDVTYTSTSGDLTFINPGTGLSVYDQTYAALSYTLVSPNPTLVTQIGATTSTVSYCFEVTVSASVTSIGFGLQGDDLDPSPIVCQPGVSSLFDELPSCICDDCEEIELSFDDFNITPNAGTGNQFNFNGNINVNVPIYGIEFQIQSYSYTANPSACTEGVSSVEESGMILMPGTTINGSTALQLFNETASGSASSNDNATKDIKYTSNTPLTGPIPVNLTIGLPGPISGLDPSCCVIDYRVCIKVKIFYEESNCKSCVFTHCFEFNNQ